jgi:hypothetical protein
VWVYEGGARKKHAGEQKQQSNETKLGNIEIEQLLNINVKSTQSTRRRNSFLLPFVNLIASKVSLFPDNALTHL